MLVLEVVVVVMFLYVWISFSHSVDAEKENDLWPERRGMNIEPKNILWNVRFSAMQMQNFKPNKREYNLRDVNRKRDGRKRAGLEQSKREIKRKHSWWKCYEKKTV